MIDNEDYSDVLEFDSEVPEPDYENDSYLEDSEEKTEQTQSKETSIQPDYSNDDLFSQDEQIEEVLSSSNDSTIQESTIQDEELSDNDRLAQDNKILNAEPTEKNKNKANKLNRQNIITIIMAVFILLIICFALIMPNLKYKKKEKSKETDKAGKVYIPTDITNYKSEETDDIQRKPSFEDGNSALQQKEELEKKFPPIIDNSQEHVAPVAIPTKKTSNSDVPLTNRNEQQKQLQRLALDRYTSPVEQERKKYPESSPYMSNSYEVPNGYTNSNSVYTPMTLSENYLAQMNSQQSGTNYNQQNDQSGKEKFLNKNGFGGKYQWNNMYSLWKGTVISAVLDTGINTDLPGTVTAHVTKNIYSSQDSRYMLIPQGSRLTGEYNSNVSYGQTRVQVVWNTLIRPDGLEINLGGLNGIDPYGHAGYKGFKSEHPFEYVKAMGLIAMYSILDTKMNNVIDTQKNQYAENVLTDVYSETKRLNNKIVDRALDIQPTITIPVGKEINLITNITIDLPPLDPYEVHEKYIRK